MSDYAIAIGSAASTSTTLKLTSDYVVGVSSYSAPYSEIKIARPIVISGIPLDESWGIPALALTKRNSAKSIPWSIIVSYNFWGGDVFGTSAVRGYKTPLIYDTHVVGRVPFLSSSYSKGVPEYNLTSSPKLLSLAASASNVGLVRSNYYSSSITASTDIAVHRSVGVLMSSATGSDSSLGMSSTISFQSMVTNGSVLGVLYGSIIKFLSGSKLDSYINSYSEIIHRAWVINTKNMAISTFTDYKVENICFDERNKSVVGMNRYEIRGESLAITDVVCDNSLSGGNFVSFPAVSLNRGNLVSREITPTPFMSKIEFGAREISGTVGKRVSDVYITGVHPENGTLEVVYMVNGEPKTVSHRIVYNKKGTEYSVLRVKLGKGARSAFYDFSISAIVTDQVVIDKIELFVKSGKRRL